MKREAWRSTKRSRRSLVSASALLLCALLVFQGGCASYPGSVITSLVKGDYVGTTVKSFLRHAMYDPDPNKRYRAYGNLALESTYETEQEKAEAVRVLIDRYEKGQEPLANRVMICRALGALRDHQGRRVLLNAVNQHDEPASGLLRAEACRALGKAGLPEDATILARIMAVDHLEDCRIAGIEGLGELKTKDPRILTLLLEGMEHDDPAVRLACVNALRKITDKDVGVEQAAWRKELAPLLADSNAPPPVSAPVPASVTGLSSSPSPAPVPAPATAGVGRALGLPPR